MRFPQWQHYVGLNPYQSIRVQGSRISSVPLHMTYSHFSFLLVSEWLRLLPLLGILALLGYLTIRPFLPKKKKQKDSIINLKIQKENPRVVNEIDIEDLRSTNVCYCRCWRSKTVSDLYYF